MLLSIDFLLIPYQYFNTLLQTTEDDLRRLFLPYGPIHSISIPVTPPDGESDRPRAKGFGFVWMLNKIDAEKAIEKTNGATLGKEEDSAKSKERIIAVDWALSKEKWSTEKQKIEKMEEEEDHATESSDTEMEEESSETGDNGEGNVPDDEVSSNSDTSEDSEGDGEEDGELHSADESGAPFQKPRLPGPDTGNTLFIRNVPFAATEDELRTMCVDKLSI